MRSRHDGLLLLTSICCALAGLWLAGCARSDGHKTVTPASPPAAPPPAMVPYPSPGATATTRAPSPSPASVTATTMEATRLPPATATATTSPEPAPAGQAVTLTVIYDNVSYDPRLVTSWGFAALVETSAGAVLFDTGGDGQILLGNMARLGIDPQRIDAVVLSHAHGDHIGGLDALLAAGAAPRIYVPSAFPAGWKRDVAAQRGAGGGRPACGGGAPRGGDRWRGGQHRRTGARGGHGRGAGRADRLRPSGHPFHGEPRPRGRGRGRDPGPRRIPPGRRRRGGDPARRRRAAGAGRPTGGAEPLHRRRRACGVCRRLRGKLFARRGRLAHLARRVAAIGAALYAGCGLHKG